MKKKSYIEFKISKKLISVMITLLCLIGGSITAFAAYSHFPLHDQDEVPVIKAHSGRRIKGVDFDPTEGLTATDKEDGDLTSKITWKLTQQWYDGDQLYEYSGSLKDGSEELKSIIEETIFMTDSKNIVEYSVTDSDGNISTSTVSYRGEGLKTNPLANK